MKRIVLILVVLVGSVLNTNAQVKTAKFGKGIQIMGKDSTFALKLGFRFQSLQSSEWTIDDGSFEDYQSSFMIRRARLKFDGWAVTPKLKYKLELGLSNRDLSGGSGSESSKAANLVLDAYLRWNFYKNLSIQIGQGKLPGNRERVISSGNMELVDRSRLNSRFTLDRDLGIQLMHKFKLNNIVFKETLAISQGEGRNITAGHFGGYGYTLKVEMLPFGDFASKGDYIGAPIVREETPKLALAAAYDINTNAVRERGQKGDFITDGNGTYYGKDIHTLSADLMFKYKSVSIMAEYAQRKTTDDSPYVFNENELLGTYYTGNAFNIQSSYMFKKNWALSGRYTYVNPDKEVALNENYYTLGLSKYIIGHKLKVQTDVTYLQKEMSNDKFVWRTQVDIHF